MIKRTGLIGILAILIGVIGSLASIAFVFLYKLANQLLWSSSQSRVGVEDSYLILMAWVLIPAMGGLLVGFLCRCSPDNRPLTLVDTIRSAQGMQFTTPFKHSFATAVASVVALGSGASVGLYGPLAHLGSAIGLAVRKLTGSTGFTPAMALGCGVAAAISTAFNAPIAGLVFAHEVILRHYSLRSFAPITVSAVIGYIFANYIVDRPPIFLTSDLEHLNSPEFLVFIVIGIVGAYVAAALVRATIYAGGIASRLSFSPVLKPAAAGAVIGVIAIWVPEILGMGESVMRDVLIGDGMQTGRLITVFVIKLLATALCLGFGMAGGIFGPSLFIGIMFGAVIGNVAEPLLGGTFSSATPYIICGMVAVVSPVIGAPLTSILIVFELARNYDLAVAAMISVVFANLVGYQLMGRSIFDIELKNQGFDLGMGRNKAILSSRDIFGCLSNDFISVTEDIVLTKLKDLLVDSGKGVGYVVDGSGRLLGELSLSKLIELEQQAVSGDSLCGMHMSESVLIFQTDQSIWSAMEQIQSFVGNSIPVVSIDNSDSNNTQDYDLNGDVNDLGNRLVGVVHESSIVKGYMDTVGEVRRDEHGID
jgi:CIC family chloride channel protein